MKIYLQNHFDWCKIMKYTLCQIIIGLLFTTISFAEKSYFKMLLTMAWVERLDYKIIYRVRDSTVRFLIA